MLTCEVVLARTRFAQSKKGPGAETTPGLYSAQPGRTFSACPNYALKLARDWPCCRLLTACTSANFVAAQAISRFRYDLGTPHKRENMGDAGLKNLQHLLDGAEGPAGQ